MKYLSNYSNTLIGTLKYTSTVYRIKPMSLKVRERQAPWESPLATALHKIEVRDSPNGIFGPWARWTRAPPDVQSCWDATAAVAVTWKFRSTFRPGNYY